MCPRLTAVAKDGAAVQFRRVSQLSGRSGSTEDLSELQPIEVNASAAEAAAWSSAKGATPLFPNRQLAGLIDLKRPNLPAITLSPPRRVPRLRPTFRNERL